MTLGRRQILKAIGLSPAAAATVIPALEASAAGIAIGAGSAMRGGEAAGIPVSGGPSRIKVLNFASWLKRRELEYRERSRDVRTLDPDIASMRLPLSTKVRWQQERNYERLIVSEKSWFDRELERYGFVETWS